MPYRDTLQARRALYTLATLQGGYFTAKQAQEAGYRYPHLVYHSQSGNFERVGQGLYRLPEIPPAEQDDLIRVTMWSRNREDVHQAVASHATALSLHGLSDLLPSRLHFTVPPTFRKRAPRRTVLHRATLSPKDVEEREGFSVTTPLRTLVDVATDGQVPREQLLRAFSDAFARGLARRSAVEATAGALSDSAAQRLRDLLARAR